MPTHYEYLGVPENASPAVIKASYRKLCLTHHPDRNPGDANASRLMQVINDAHEVLGDPAKRHEYDQELRLSRMREAVPADFGRPRPPAWRPSREDARWASRYQRQYPAYTPSHARARRPKNPWEDPSDEDTKPDRFGELAGWFWAFFAAAAVTVIVLLISWSTLPPGTPRDSHLLSAIVHNALLGFGRYWHLIAWAAYAAASVERGR